MRGLLKQLTPNGLPLIVASIIAGFVLAISVTASAQSMSGRGVDMRSLSGQAASCRTPALKLKQEIIVLRQDLSEILECNSEGSFFVDGDCVPYITPGHAFQVDHGASNEDALSFDDPSGPQWAEIGGADGPDVECVPEISCEPGSPDWPECFCETFPTHPSCDDDLPCEDDPDHPDYPDCGGDCAEGHNDPACCDEFPEADICSGSCIWEVDDWGSCSQVCGGGFMERTATCSCGPGNCEGPKPSETGNCNTHFCEWNIGVWGDCSHECGGGTRTRQVTCAAPGPCDPDNKPAVIQSCNTHQCPGGGGPLCPRQVCIGPTTPEGECMSGDWHFIICE